MTLLNRRQSTPAERAYRGDVDKLLAEAREAKAALNATVEYAEALSRKVTELEAELHREYTRGEYLERKIAEGVVLPAGPATFQAPAATDLRRIVAQQRRNLVAMADQLAHAEGRTGAVRHGRWGW